MQALKATEVLKGLLSSIGAYNLYERWLWSQIKEGKMPEHIAIILDGNRRWASKRFLESWVKPEWKD